jgi:hypothetical protein
MKWDDPGRQNTRYGMTALGALRKLMFEIGCFRFCPEVDLPLRPSETRPQC